MMQRIYNFTFLRVELDKPFPYLRKATVKDGIVAARDLKESIKRHCDGFDSIDIEHDFDEVCEFCGSSWTEDSDTYNGGCCERDSEQELQSPENKE